MKVDTGCHTFCIRGSRERGFGELKLGDGGIAKASVKKRDSQIEPETG